MLRAMPPPKLCGISPTLYRTLVERISVRDLLWCKEWSRPVLTSPANSPFAQAASVPSANELPLQLDSSVTFIVSRRPAPTRRRFLGIEQELLGRAELNAQMEDANAQVSVRCSRGRCPFFGAGLWFLSIGTDRTRRRSNRRWSRRGALRTIAPRLREQGSAGRAGRRQLPHLPRDLPETSQARPL